MKLSIIVPIYRDIKKLRKYLDQIIEQTSDQYELILIIDTLKDNPLSEVDYFFEKFPFLKSQSKLIFNSKRLGRTAAIKAGAELATGDYCIIMSNTDRFDDTFVAEVNKVASSHKSDIIEFNAYSKSPIRMGGEVRKVYKPQTSIEENKEIFAYTFALDFNKLYKTDVIKKATQFLFTSPLNSRYSIELVFKALIVASTYSSADLELIKFKADVSDNFNPLKQIRQWKSWHAFLSKNMEGKYLSESIYNFLFTELLITSRIVNKARSKMLESKYHMALADEVSSLNVQANEYLIQKNAEANKLNKALAELE